MSTLTSLSDKRRLRRHQLSTRIEVVDTHGQQPLGFLVNIHEEGLLVLGTPLGLQSTWQISLVLPNSVNQQRQIDIGVDCLWCQPAQDDGELHWSGCSIIDKSDLAEESIRALIAMQTQ